MNPFDGTAARQLVLMDDEGERPIVWRETQKARPMLRMLRKDVYAELTRRRRRAQIAARHLVEDR